MKKNNRNFHDFVGAASGHSLVQSCRTGHNGHTRVFIGGSFWFGPPPYWGPPAWGPRAYYGAPVYYGPPAMIIPQSPAYMQQPQVYVQRGQAESGILVFATTHKASTPTSSPVPAAG